MANVFSQNVKLMRYPHHTGFTHGMAFGEQVANIFLNPRPGGQLEARRYWNQGLQCQLDSLPVCCLTFSLCTSPNSPLSLCSPAFSVWSPVHRAELMTAQVSWGYTVQPDRITLSPNFNLQGLRFWLPSLGQPSYPWQPEVRMFNKTILGAFPLNWGTQLRGLLGAEQALPDEYTLCTCA